MFLCVFLCSRAGTSCQWTVQQAVGPVFLPYCAPTESLWRCQHVWLCLSVCFSLIQQKPSEPNQSPILTLTSVRKHTQTCLNLKNLPFFFFMVPTVAKTYLCHVLHLPWCQVSGCHGNDSGQTHYTQTYYTEGRRRRPQHLTNECFHSGERTHD